MNEKEEIRACVYVYAAGYVLLMAAVIVAVTIVASI